MTRDPVTGQKLDERYQFVIVDGPSWERLCDGLKYQGIYDHVQIEFTYVDHRDGSRERKLRGKVCAIIGEPGSHNTDPLVKLVPDYDRSTDPTPVEIKYWPNRRQGHVTNISMKMCLPSTTP